MCEYKYQLKVGDLVKYMHDNTGVNQLPRYTKGIVVKVQLQPSFIRVEWLDVDIPTKDNQSWIPSECLVVVHRQSVTC